MIKKESNSLLERAIEFIKGLESVDATTLQRHFRITWMSAGKLLDEMAQQKLISAKKDNKGFHKVLKRQT